LFYTHYIKYLSIPQFQRPFNNFISFHNHKKFLPLKMNCDRLSMREGDGRFSPSPSQDDENEHDTVRDRRDTTIHYPSTNMGKIPTETLPRSCGDLFASTWMDTKPAARPKDQVSCTCTPELRNVRSLPFLGRSSEDHPQPLASFANQTRSWDRKQVELLPGYYVSLIGSEETWQAFCEDNVVTTECSSCQNFLYCKDTVSMVICPGCRVISPVDEAAGLGTEMLGLGLTVEVAFEI
jgi:hypothetical protein